VQNSDNEFKSTTSVGRAFQTLIIIRSAQPPTLSGTGNE